MVIQFQAKDSGDSGANQESAESSFVSLGSQVEAVVMRLKTRLPRIRVAGSPRYREEEVEKSPR